MVMTILDYSFWYIDYQPFSLNLRVVTKRCNWQDVEKILCWVEILKGILDGNCLKWGKFKDFVYISRSSIVFDDIKCGTNYCCVGNSKPVVHTLSDRGTNSLICSSHEWFMLYSDWLPHTFMEKIPPISLTVTHDCMLFITRFVTPN